jgi:hypothetical protein
MANVLRDYFPAILILGIPSVVFSILFIVRDGALRRRGVTVQAKCVNLGRDAKGGVSLQLQYVVDGTAYTLESLPYKFPPAGIGGRLPVVYDPRHPTYSKMKTELGRGIAPWIVGGISAAFIVAALVARI